MISQNTDAELTYVSALEAKVQQPSTEYVSHEELKALIIQVRRMVPRLKALETAANSQPNF
jgi:hypothetical protein